MRREGIKARKKREEDMRVFLYSMYVNFLFFSIIKKIFEIEMFRTKKGKKERH